MGGFCFNILFQFYPLLFYIFLLIYAHFEIFFFYLNVSVRIFLTFKIHANHALHVKSLKGRQIIGEGQWLYLYLLHFCGPCVYKVALTYWISNNFQDHAPENLLCTKYPKAKKSLERNDKVMTPSRYARFDWFAFVMADRV